MGSVTNSESTGMANTGLMRPTASIFEKRHFSIVSPHLHSPTPPSSQILSDHGVQQERNKAARPVQSHLSSLLASAADTETEEQLNVASMPSLSPVQPPSNKPNSHTTVTYEKTKSGSESPNGASRLMKVLNRMTPEPFGSTNHLVRAVRSDVNGQSNIQSLHIPSELTEMARLAQHQLQASGQLQSSPVPINREQKETNMEKKQRPAKTKKASNILRRPTKMSSGSIQPGESLLKTSTINSAKRRSEPWKEKVERKKPQPEPISTPTATNQVRLYDILSQSNKKKVASGNKNSQLLAKQPQNESSANPHQKTVTYVLSPVDERIAGTGHRMRRLQRKRVRKVAANRNMNVAATEQSHQIRFEYTTNGQLVLQEPISTEPITTATSSGQPNKELDSDDIESWFTPELMELLTGEAIN